MSDLSFIWLEEAFAWTCPSCQKRNGTDWVPEELDSQTIDELRKDGEQLGSSVFSYRLPYKVKCCGCRSVYAVANHILEDEQDAEEEEEDDY